MPEHNFWNDAQILFWQRLKLMFIPYKFYKYTKILYCFVIAYIDDNTDDFFKGYPVAKQLHIQ